MFVPCVKPKHTEGVNPPLGVPEEEDNERKANVPMLFFTHVWGTTSKTKASVVSEQSVSMGGCGLEPPVEIISTFFSF